MTYTPVTGPFPPPGPVTMTAVIPSYLYEEYNDDPNLQAFVSSYNVLAQTFVNTLNDLNLPVYTGDNISGALLDWVAQGLYGIARPALASGQNVVAGLLNTYEFNTTELDASAIISPSDIVATSDDTFKRVITWLFYKGDGKRFSVKWLKRRIMRFLIGVNGTAPDIQQTYKISVTFGVDNEIEIRFIDAYTTVTGGAIFDTGEFNTTELNELTTLIQPVTPLPYREIFQEGVQTGVLELPFQYVWNVVI